MKISVWFVAIRPKTLTAAFVPVLVGTALVAASGYSVQWNLSLFASLSAFCIQSGTNLFNDALDFKKGADTTARLGPLRVTQGQLLSYKEVWVGALFCFALAVAFAIPLIFQGGWPIIIIGILALLFGYAYTGGPFPLSYLGFGDLFVLLFFGLIATGGTFFLHTGWWSLESLVAGLQIGFLATVLIAINNLRDVQTDRQVNKKTIAVRFGVAFSKKEIFFLLTAPFLLGFFWMMRGYVLAALLPIVSLSVVVSLIRGIYSNSPSAIYNQFLEKAALLHLMFGLLLAIGLFLE
ncbi:MAG: 1,4-dihydroxy-2-naphthoate octaprenyltransferase [Deltaproteobacteria bacterium RIFCSPLOWO2_01_44_7]|nr:MAG: 1,4-dihydroxy-2-naphthoate octaprenyltransferase [Deltaproteobacteria bacterium RIFCSPHIGHO2_01_FULL_43_49]OGQ14207.1 MAG: 1,4-dihydroxy-2-naphthoate octaprenyltransferase [Deltaproteobacteria bacterium RIFCSPHIGHO2_02_FULL_44_53]OGQ27423.1 MAG: 1,4-dihydroxy-2-naphthoate octaprenyltransferase [Deltaproteobacteria bacterium RIFCSPHIGHO2_12_FULL_44_21]OGQ30671.1 MAG: 1,4-dihydroxy-2-naphthoate octaprenyltransferase [Deltaproteobacteria bacterium RIFCSPLOWO2_01_FULL_45_74]OGQ37740.1 MAG: 